MSGRFAGKAALITGAGSGIGRAIATRFAQEGGAALIAEINPQTGREAAREIESAGGKALFFEADASRREPMQAAVERCVEAFGSIDFLVSNAWGEGMPLRFEWIRDEEMRHALDLGLLSGYWLMQAAFPHMKRQGGGSILSVCSLNGVNAHMYSAFYNAAKEGLRSMTRTVAREWARHQIRANVICPAAATTAYRRFAEQQPENAAAMAAQNPMGRIGDPLADIAGVACFLASDDARYLTGNTLFADGGSHINGVAWAPELPEERPELPEGLGGSEGK